MPGEVRRVSGGVRSARRGEESARRGEESARRGEESVRRGEESVRRGEESARRGEESVRRGEESARRGGVGRVRGGVGTDNNCNTWQRNMYTHHTTFTTIRGTTTPCSPPYEVPPHNREAVHTRVVSPYLYTTASMLSAVATS